MAISLGVNWRTNLISIIVGVATLLMGIPIFVQAVTAWSKHQAVDWRSVLVATAFAMITAGLAMAKDKQTNSTLAQVTAMQDKIEGKPDADAKLKAANAQVEATKL